MWGTKSATIRPGDAAITLFLSVCVIFPREVRSEKYVLCLKAFGDRHCAAELCHWPGSCHKYYFCHDKIISVCRDKIFLSRHKFCRDKNIFVVTNTCLILSRQKMILVAASANDRAQELCESRGSCPGLPSLISLRFLWMLKDKSKVRGDF